MLNDLVCEPDQFRINFNFETISNRGNLHLTQVRLLWHPNIDIWNSNLVIKKFIFSTLAQISMLLIMKQGNSIENNLLIQREKL